MENSTNAVDNTIKFGQQFTIEQFKAKAQCSKIDIVKNPHTGKTFFVAGSLSGKVSKKGYSNPVISECTDEKGEKFYMLHSKSESNIIASL